MPSVDDFPAAGAVTAVNHDIVTFLPHGTTYELELAIPGGYAGPLNRRFNCLIRAKARKVFTTGAGGSFVTPIFGRPRVIQGRVLYVEDGRIVVRAGVNIVVELPARDNAIDLERGPIETGSLVNVVAEPGAAMERLAPVAVQSA
ncbi:MAG: hypothetical protein ABSH20_01210 [Tepidisphaeraceae bacterium]